MFYGAVVRPKETSITTDYTSARIMKLTPTVQKHGRSRGDGWTHGVNDSTVAMFPVGER